MNFNFLSDEELDRRADLNDAMSLAEWRAAGVRVYNAAYCNQTSLLKKEMLEGAHPDATGKHKKTGLMVTAYGKCARILLRNLADPTLVDETEQDALMHQIKKGDAGIVKMIAHHLRAYYGQTLTPAYIHRIKKHAKRAQLNRVRGSDEIYKFIVHEFDWSVKKPQPESPPAP